MRIVMVELLCYFRIIIQTFPFVGNPWWTSLVAFVPALLACILIFMDQQITAVIVNRKEHKLKVRLISLLDAIITITIPKILIMLLPFIRP